jgi:hypothetical protein
MEAKVVVTDPNKDLARIIITEPNKAFVNIVPAPGATGAPGLGAEALGVEGNNELEIFGIENTTVIDSVPINEWRWLKYTVSLSKISGGVNKFYATELTILIDTVNINVSESGVIDNDGDMGTISVSRNGSNLQLVVTPLQNIRPITVRYARVGLRL